MAKIPDLFLEGQQRIYFIGNPTRIYLGIFKKGPNYRFSLVLKNLIGRIEFFCGVFSNFCKKETKDNITSTDRIIIFVLEPDIGDGIQKIFPLYDFQIDSFFM